MVTIFEFLALALTVALPITVGRLVYNFYGALPGIAAGVCCFGICATIVFFAYRASGRQHAARQRELREKYRSIYRVIAVPNDARKIHTPEGAEIKVGDYGWEAEPLHEDGLVYLQGLTRDWRVVWYAGFFPDQVETVGPKPQSQYDWEYSWVRKPPECPFTVLERQTPVMGLPTPNPHK